MADTRTVEQEPFCTSPVPGSVAAGSPAVSRSTSVLPEAPRTGLTALHGHG